MVLALIESILFIGLLGLPSPKCNGPQLIKLWFSFLAKMAQYHLFLKFLATEHCFGNYWRSTTFSGTRVWWARVPYFLIHRGTMTWKARIKIFCLVLDHLKLEYCWTVFESYKIEYRMFIYRTPLKWTDGCLAGNH